MRGLLGQGRPVLDVDRPGLVCRVGAHMALVARRECVCVDWLVCCEHASMIAIASEMTSDDILMCVPEVCARCHSSRARAMRVRGHSGYIAAWA